MEKTDKELMHMWAVFAFLSAIFAALTSILAKVGIDGVNSTLATAIRTVVVLAMSWGMVLIMNVQKWPWRYQQKELAFLDSFRFGYRRVLAVLLSCAAAGRSFEGCAD